MNTRSVCTVVAALSALLALGCAALAVGHSGVAIPLLSRIGPGGNEAVVPAAVAFTVATILLALTSYGIVRRQAWAWALGLALHSLIFLGSALPYRGVASLVALIISGTCVALLLTRTARGALLAR